MEEEEEGGIMWKEREREVVYFDQHLGAAHSAVSLHKSNKVSTRVCGSSL